MRRFTVMARGAFALGCASHSEIEVNGPQESYTAARGNIHPKTKTGTGLRNDIGRVGVFPNNAGIYDAQGRYQAGLEVFPDGKIQIDR